MDPLITKRYIVHDGLMKVAQIFGGGVKREVYGWANGLPWWPKGVGWEENVPPPTQSAGS